MPIKTKITRYSQWLHLELPGFGAGAPNSLKGAREWQSEWLGVGENVDQDNEPREEKHIWRIFNYKLIRVKKINHGRFFSGDSYIVLVGKVNKTTKKRSFDIHMWAGENSSAEEYKGALGYVAELEAILPGHVITHREVQNHESELFFQHFKYIEYMKGTSETSYENTPTGQYQKFIRVSMKGNGIRCREMAAKVGNLTRYDVFLVDLGNTIYQLNGEWCQPEEITKAAAFTRHMNSVRHNKVQIYTMNESEEKDNDPHSPEYETFMKNIYEGEKDKEEKLGDEKKFTPTLFQVVDEKGKLEKLSEGRIEKELFGSSTSQGVLLLDWGRHCFVWFGSKVSALQKINGLVYAHNYLRTTEHPLVPITTIEEGDHNELFNSILNPKPKKDIAKLTSDPSATTAATATPTVKAKPGSAGTSASGNKPPLAVRTKPGSRA